MNELLKQLPDMLFGEDLEDALLVVPEYDNQILLKPAAERLIGLNEMYKLFLPNYMTKEIYVKLYLAMARSLDKKNTVDAVRQRNENYRAILQKEHNSIIGGADSFTIIAPSGIGKSTCINRTIEVITKEHIIIQEKPVLTKIIPALVVQCPADCSSKGLLLEILRKVDMTLKTSYYSNALKARATIDMLIGSVSNIALSHLSLLVIDEIQNVGRSKNGRSLVGVLTQLINNSGISICFVGVPESAVFFEAEAYLARRSQGLRYEKLAYDDYFKTLCRTLLSFQYAKKSIVPDEAVYQWLYEHSGGITSMVVSLIHDANEIAIVSGAEEISRRTLSEAYERARTMHSYMIPERKVAKTTRTTKGKLNIAVTGGNEEFHKFSDIIQEHRTDVSDLTNALISESLLEVISV